VLAKAVGKKWKARALSNVGKKKEILEEVFEQDEDMMSPKQMEQMDEMLMASINGCNGENGNNHQ